MVSTTSMSRAINSDLRRRVRLPIPLHELTADDPDLICPEPLIKVHDRIVSSSARSSKTSNTSKATNQTQSRLIPRIVHLSMRSRCMPPDLANTVFRWQEALPNHDVYFHDDEAVERLLREDPWPEFPHLLKVYDSCIQVKGAVMVDIWRVLILYRYGGLYSDIDNWPLPPFTEEMPIKPDDSAFFFSDSWNRPSQWFMSMEPNHPIAYFSMQEILKRILSLDAIEKIKPVFTTGPDAVKHGYMAFLEGNGESHDDIFHQKVHVARKEFNHSHVTKSEREGGQYLRKGLGGTFGEKVNWTDPETGRIEQITRKEKCERQSGVIHWTKKVRQRARESEKPKGSCLNRLFFLDTAGLRVR